MLRYYTVVLNCWVMLQKHCLVCRAFKVHHERWTYPLRCIFFPNFSFPPSYLFFSSFYSVALPSFPASLPLCPPLLCLPSHSPLLALPWTHPLSSISLLSYCLLYVLHLCTLFSIILPPSPVSSYFALALSASTSPCLLHKWGEEGFGSIQPHTMFSVLSYQILSQTLRSLTPQLCDPYFSQLS